MAARLKNLVHVEGYFYGVGTGNNALAIKTVKRADSANFGMSFIGGEIQIATDEACTNIVRIHYTYEPEYRIDKETGERKENRNFRDLKKLLDNGNYVLAVGKENADKVAINTTLVENAWVSRDNEVVSSAQLEGGFITLNPILSEDEAERARFEVDMFLADGAVKHVEHEDSEETLKLHGGVFNFRNDINIIDLVGTGNMIDFFEDLIADGPVFACVTGVLDFANIEATIEEEGAFGPIVRKISRRKRDFVIKNVKDYDRPLEDGVPFNGEDIKKALQDREVRLADVKKNYEDYQANKAAGAFSGTATTSPVASMTPAQTSIPKEKFKF